LGKKFTSILKKGTKEEVAGLTIYHPPHRRNDGRAASLLWKRRVRANLKRSSGSKNDRLEKIGY
jgi:hypothetical protein